MPTEEVDMETERAEQTRDENEKAQEFEEVVTEEEKAKRDNDITEIKTRLRKLDIAIDTWIQENNQRGNSACGTIGRCVWRFWEVEGELVTTYKLRTMTPEQEMQAIEYISEHERIDKKDWHKSLLAPEISREIDDIFDLLQAFCRRNESEKHKTDRLQKEAKRREEEARRLAAAVQNRDDYEKAMQKIIQRLSEQAQAEAADAKAKDTWSAARLKLAGDLGTMRKTYEGLVSRFGEGTANFFRPKDDPKYVHDGDILLGLYELSAFTCRRTTVSQEYTRANLPRKQRSREHTTLGEH
jgi:hypothetical protein